MKDFFSGAGTLDVKEEPYVVYEYAPELISN
jgi:hypothetical protein